VKAKPMMPDWPRVMRREKAAAYLDMSPSMLDREVAVGNIPQPILLTRSIKGWPREDLDGWIDKRRDAIMFNEWDEK